jgi:hypothetical protein
MSQAIKSYVIGECSIKHLTMSKLALLVGDERLRKINSELRWRVGGKAEGDRFFRSIRCLERAYKISPVR